MKICSSSLFLSVILTLTFATQKLGVAQQTQVPTLQVCNRTIVVGDAVFRVDARSDATHAGTFELKIEASCDPGSSGYPGGSLTISKVSLTDSLVSGDILAGGAEIEQMTSTGVATPTAYLNGRCRGATAPIPGCRFWILIADNQEVPAHPKTPDVASVLVFDKTGKTVLYATAPALQGHIKVSH